MNKTAGEFPKLCLNPVFHILLIISWFFFFFFHFFPFPGIVEQRLENSFRFKYLDLV